MTYCSGEDLALVMYLHDVVMLLLQPLSLPLLMRRSQFHCNEEHFPITQPLNLYVYLIRSLSGTSSFSNDTVRFTAVSAHVCYNGDFGI